MKTKKQAVTWIYNSIDKQFDYDGWYGFQCFDIVNSYWSYVVGGSLAGVGAKDIPFANDFTGKATVYKNTPSFLPQAGDIVVWGASLNGGFGHTAIVTSANLEKFVVVEQNWLSGGWTDGIEKGGTGWEKTTQRTHTYSSDMWFIRPKFKTSVVAKAKKTVKKTVKKVAPKKKGKKILLVAGHGYRDVGAVGNATNERDYIRQYIVPNVKRYLEQAGHTVVLYGGSKMSQDMFQDTRVGTKSINRNEYGLYWVKRQGYDMVIEFHLDSAGASASGGHVIIGKGLEADAVDIGIQQALRKSVGLIREIDRRDDLLNVNVSKALNINYRLVELGFISSKKDMTYINKNLKSFTKAIAEGIHGGTIGKPISKKPSSTITYTVKSGDTLWSIAGKYNVNVNELKSMNGLKTNVIHTGDKLKVKK